MGFLEIAAATKFLSNADLIWNWGIFTHDVVLAIWVAVMFIMTIYLLGKFTLPHDSPATGSLSAGRAFASMLTLGAGIWLTTGLAGRSLGTLESFLPPPIDGASAVRAVGATTTPELSWPLNDLPGAIAIAKQSNKHVFVDYTGYTCINCRNMERDMFPRPEIKAALSKFVLARLYTDGDGEIYEKQQAQEKKEYGTVALPLYAIVDGNGKTIATFPGATTDPQEFLTFLTKEVSRPEDPQ